MAISTFDLFKIGIGPSSSHTVGPMRAAAMFVQALRDTGKLREVVRIKADMYGSLGATGRGHGTPKAVLLGLEGERPESVDVDAIAGRVAAIRLERSLLLNGHHRIAFDEKHDLLLHRRKALPLHPNGMRFTAYSEGGGEHLVRVFYSVGGGFVLDESGSGVGSIVEDRRALAYRFGSAAELLSHCERSGLSISAIMLANEPGVAPRGGNAVRPAPHLGGDAAMRRRRLPQRRRAAGRAEGEAARAGAAQPVAGEPRSFAFGPAHRARLGDTLRARRQRGECGRRAGGDGAHQRRGRHRARGAALLFPLRARRQRRRRDPLPADRRRDRRALQAERLHQRRRSGLPGGGSARPVRWRPAGSPKSSEERRGRWRTRPKLAWNTTWG